MQQKCKTLYTDVRTMLKMVTLVDRSCTAYSCLNEPELRPDVADSLKTFNICLSVCVCVCV